MATFTYIHAADLHIDSPLIGLSNYPGVPADQVRGASREAFRNLVQLAIANNVDFVLLVGDIYDGDWRDYNTGLFFAAELSKLREASIPVVVLLGNHDAASIITKQLKLPDNVTKVSHLKPETKRFEKLGVAIHGQSYATRDVLENLVLAYPKALADYFNIGLLHTALTGRPGHAPYAPCSIGDLTTLNYNYWGLGHIHMRDQISTDPWIVFPGNIQGRDIKETGPKGCTLVTVEDGEVLSVKFEPLDVVRWAICDISGDLVTNGPDLIDLEINEIRAIVDKSEGRPVVIRINVTGPCRAHGELSGDAERWINEVRAAATEISNGTAWIEQVRLHTRTIEDLEILKNRDDAIGGMVRALLRIQSDASIPNEFITEAKELIQKLPIELKHEPDFDLSRPDTQARLVEEVSQMLMPLLLKRAGEK